MAVIRIWALESDYDRDTVGKLARKLVDWSNGEDVTILTAGKTTYNSVAKRKKTNGLQIAVESYLQNNEDKIIFVVDSDSEASLADRRGETYSLINQIERIIKSEKFFDRVFLAMAVQELEAWLLTDCLGIYCYFAKRRYSANDCRQRVVNNQHLQSIIKKYQKGNTELIVEPVRGGKGAKEYMVRFSEEILKLLNPKMKPRNIKAQRYREALSPEIASYVEISEVALKRNNSLRYLLELISS